MIERAVFFSGAATTNADAPLTEDSTQLPMDGAEWVELFVREMMSASNIGDARARASRALEVLEKSICARAGAEAAKSFHQVVYLKKKKKKRTRNEKTSYLPISATTKDEYPSCWVCFECDFLIIFHIVFRKI